jgi:hypothetical protein
MLQTVDQAGLPGDDPDAEWIITRITATVSLFGSFKLTALSPSGVSTDLTGPFDLAAGTPLDMECLIPAGKQRDVGYTTTGTGATSVVLKGRPVRYGKSRPLGPEIP